MIRKILKGSYSLVLISFSFSFITSTHGLYCHVCSSDKLEDCSTLHSLEGLPTELCPENSVSCFTKIADGITVRGCMRRQKERIKYTSFIVCKSNNCNAQIFPENRLSCLHCEGSSCVNQSNSIDVRYPCVNYHPNDQCYSIISHDGSMAYRGCMSDKNQIGKDFCIMNIAQCYQCSTRACNSNPLAFELALSCVKCDPDENSDCNIIDENTEAAECNATTMGFNNTCYTYTNDGSTHRGCLYEASDEIFNECHNVFSDKCSMCSQNNCNRMPITNENESNSKNEADYSKSSPYDNGNYTNIKENQHESELNIQHETCIECDSIKDERCRRNPAAFQGKMCSQDFSTQIKGCYLSIVDDRIQRGCIKDLSPIMEKLCLSNLSNCKSCTGNNCNVKAKFHECYNCNSKTDPQCAINVLLTNTKICRTYHSECLTGIDKNGYTHRRCANQQTNYEREFSDKFILCSDEKCNGEIFPNDRLKCYQCDGGKGCDMTEQKKLKPEPCTIQSRYDHCFTYVNREKKMFRGCLTDATNARLLCDRADENGNGTCVKCSSDGCNNHPKFRKSNLSCVKCTELENTEECAFGQNTSVAIACKEPVVFGDRETCFTLSVNATSIAFRSSFHFNRSFARNIGQYISNGLGTQNSYRVERGCTLDINSETDWCKKEAGCLKCSDPGCNSQNAKWSFCSQCSSDMNGNCAVISNQDDYTTLCARSSYPYSKKGCYTDTRDGKINRGCIADLNEEQYQKCQAETESCVMCSKNNCNNKDVSSSVRVSSTSILFFLVLLIAHI